MKTHIFMQLKKKKKIIKKHLINQNKFLMKLYKIWKKNIK